MIPMSAAPTGIGNDGRGITTPGRRVRQPFSDVVAQAVAFVERWPASARRKVIGDLVEELIAMLDAEDGDPDLENGFDAEGDRSDYEPSLGWLESGYFGNSDGLDREQDNFARGGDVRKARERYRRRYSGAHR